MSAIDSPARRRLSWTLFLLIAGSGFYLESTYREMFYSKLLIVGSLAVWAWTMARPLRFLHLGLVLLFCSFLIYNKYHYRHQHLVRLSTGVYRIVN